MIKLVTIIGARPQIIKAAALSRAIANHFSDQIQEILVHTGQHYDDNMSQVFFDELGIPKPNYNLNIGSGSHGKQTARMIEDIEEILLKEKPDYIVVYGDTNSTLAGGIAASKIQIPIVHIEAGLRSFNKQVMPEEINRVICDHVSTLLFCPTDTGYKNLLKEGFKENNKAPYTIDNPKIYHCGDVMYDNSLYFSMLAESKTDILENHGLKTNAFILATIHRNNNTDDPKRLTAIFSALHTITQKDKIPVILPLHPRTNKLMAQNLPVELYHKIKTNPLIKIIPPVSFLEMIALEKNASIILTDSGGVQKEAFFFQKSCVIMRTETEWKEIVECGAAIVSDANEEQILAACNTLISGKNISFPSIFGDGKASEFICRELLSASK